MLYIYSPSVTPRIEYIAHCLQNWWGFAVVATSVKTDCLEHPYINYSAEINHNAYTIFSNGLLQEKEIIAKEIFVKQNNQFIYFFENINCPHGFDVLACIFYCISRYEEYLPYKNDDYGRFSHTNSWAYKNSCLNNPIVNFWLNHLQEKLKELYPFLPFKKQQFSFIPTYDVDIAFAYKYHNPLLNVVKFFKDVLTRNIDAVEEKMQVFSVKKDDPFDSFNWLHNMHTKYFLQPIYFFLVSKKRSKYDKNCKPFHKGFQQFIFSISKYNIIGIHPSWQSGVLQEKNIDTLLKEEAKLLHYITNKNILNSRQHYIKMQLSNTYETLINAGITDDYSMGYATTNGFRASIANSFYWYNLHAEKTTNLLIHPFCFMDSNCIFKTNSSVNEAENELYQYYNIVKQVQGNLITIFHNHFLTTQNEWLVWRNMYENFLKEVSC